jgi:tetraacyldisaccharide 4'-kinase
MGNSLFNPLAPLVSSLVRARNWAFDAKLFKTVHLKIPVISVGNITMGGTGKTPFINWLLSEVSDLGYRPGVITRNYRASLKEPGWVHTNPGSFLMFGDEAVFLKLKNPAIPILSGPRKWENALQMEHNGEGVNVVLVDDGFQHRRLHRDIDIILLDLSVAPKDYEWPPWGRARESLKSLERAHVVVYTRWEQRREDTLDFIKSHLPHGLIELQAEQIAELVHWVAGRPFQDIELAKKGAALAFCGLGNPESFFKTLEAQGVKIGKKIRFPDHSDYDAKKIAQLVELGAKYDYLVTSEKDMVKLQDWPFHGPSLCVTPMRLKLGGSLEAFREKLARSLWTNS